MKLALILVLVSAVAGAKKKPVFWPEQEGRMIVGQTELESPLCYPKTFVVSLKMTIGKTGEVSSVEENKESRLQKPAKKAIEFVMKWARGWTFRPLKVGNEFVEVKTKPTVTCRLPGS